MTAVNEHFIANLFRSVDMKRIENFKSIFDSYDQNLAFFLLDHSVTVIQTLRKVKSEIYLKLNTVTHN